MKWKVDGMAGDDMFCVNRGAKRGSAVRRVRGCMFMACSWKGEHRGYYWRSPTTGYVPLWHLPPSLVSSTKNRYILHLNWGPPVHTHTPLLYKPLDTSLYHLSDGCNNSVTPSVTSFFLSSLTTHNSNSCTFSILCFLHSKKNYQYRTGQ